MAELITEKQRHALSGWPMALFFLAMLVFAIHSGTRMVAAGDTWVAMASGRHFLAHGVDTVEPFSANSHRPGPTQAELEKYPEWLHGVIKKLHPTGWVNQNWLTHVMFYWLTHKSPLADAEKRSFNALVYWKFSLCILTVLCVYYIGRMLGVNPALAAISACFAVFVGRSFIDIRPQVFTNLLVPIFMLILILATYRNILYIWLLVPLGVFWCNVHGGYVYLFIMLVPFVKLHLPLSLSKKWTAILNLAIWFIFFLFVVVINLTKFKEILNTLFLKIFLLLVMLTVLDIVLVFSKKWFVSIGLKGVYQTILAGFAAFIAVVVFNPFHLTNLTHTFIVSVSKHAELWRTVNEWHPAFEWSNPVGTGKPFAVMFGISLGMLGIWLIALALRPDLPAKFARREAEKDSGQYQWPRVDLPIISMAALTIYMAIRSRRFIPIAANVGCPVIAMLVDQSVRMICAKLNYNRRNRLVVPPMPWALQMTVAALTAVGIVFFSTWWGLKFKRIYLNPWTTDYKFTSVFMRMSASYAKPFYAGQFIKENHLKGKIFNYWTEGGFIAYAQDPDPNTGKTPLQLFMDGRAQAAYKADDYRRWATIMAGGPLIHNIKLAGREPTASEYNKIGQWIDRRFKAESVWVVLMPTAQFNSTLMRALERQNNWRVVFISDKQKMIVDYDSPQGRNLLNGVFANQTKYSDDAHKFMALAYNMLRSSDEKVVMQGLSLAARSLKLNPSQTVMIEILNAIQKNPKLANFMGGILKEYLLDFDKNRERYLEEDGYAKRMLPALSAARYLEKVSIDPKFVQFCSDRKKVYEAEQSYIFKYTKW